MSDAQLLGMVIKKLESLEEKLDTMLRDGCAKAPGHAMVASQQDGLFKRVRELELEQASGKGKLVVVSSIASAILTAGLGWLFKKW